MSFKSKLKRRLAKVDDSKMYNPEQVTDLGLILNINFEPSRHKVYRLIKRGGIPVVNMGTDAQPRWFIQGSDLRKFVESRYLQE